MLFNPFLEQRLAEDRVKDALREAERARLIRAAKGAGLADRAALHSLLIKVRDLGLPLISVNRIEHDPTQTRKGVLGRESSSF